MTIEKLTGDPATLEKLESLVQQEIYRAANEGRFATFIDADNVGYELVGLLRHVVMPSLRTRGFLCEWPNTESKMFVSWEPI